MNPIGRDFFTLVAPAHTPTLTGDFLDLTPSFEAHRDTLKGAIFIAPTAGSQRTVTFVVGGVWVAGETIRVTLTAPASSRQTFIKSYKYTVPVGGTATTAIATALDAMIGANDADTNQPYTSGVAASTVTVTLRSNDTRGLTGTQSVVSVAGTITVGGTNGTNSEGQAQDLLDKGVPADLVTLASYDTVRIAYQPLVAQPHEDSYGYNAREIFWYGSPGTGTSLALTINNIAGYVS